ncbi:sulfatase family protein [Deinococcus marmoris]|uniref:Choline-sulfatase n=1 Tax=Deinococcus marmoris TaxID=249408 RepID=A0A1U7P010_9DEIO|nr:sulfatase-like hydrolase/transferase [Deinococcus marmoris]OLV18490.1 Choline-sulfatase [Deinococcus marmoris]
MQNPNILLFYTDQQRWDTLSVNGNRETITPNLDALVREGVNFDHFFVQHPLCMPSRVSFLSGQYPSSLRITQMGVPVPEDLVTLPHLLRAAGYRTANIGKLHFLPHANRDHRRPHPPYGFDTLLVSDEPGVYEDAYRAWVRARDPQQLEHLSVGLPPAAYRWYVTMGIDDMVPQPVPGERYDFGGATPFPGDERYTHSAFVADQTLNFLDGASARQPFFAIASFFSPHAPWVVPQRFLDLYDPQTFTAPTYPPELQAERYDHACSPEELRSAKHGYYAMISEVDEYVGVILARLEALGLSENTIVVFVSDHGEWLGEHLKYGKGYPGDDSVARVPFIIRWPAGIREVGRSVTELVEAVDVLPTLLELAGLQTPPEAQGHSLAPHLRDSARPIVQKPALMEYAGWKNLRTPAARYLIHENGTEALWDLQNDPHEYFDVAAEQPELVAQHRKLLLEKLLEIERPLPRIWAY